MLRWSRLSCGPCEVGGPGVVARGSCHGRVPSPKALRARFVAGHPRALAQGGAQSFRRHPSAPPARPASAALARNVHLDLARTANVTFFMSGMENVTVDGLA